MRCKKKRLTLSAFWQEQKQDIWTKMLRKLEGRNNFLAGLVFLVCIVCCGDGLMIWCFPIYPGGTRVGEPCGWLYRLYRVYRVYTAVQLTMWLSVTDGAPPCTHLSDQRAEARVEWWWLVMMVVMSCPCGETVACPGEVWEVQCAVCSVKCECGLTPSSGDTDMCGAGPWPGETVRNVLTAGLSWHFATQTTQSRALQ